MDRSGQFGTPGISGGIFLTSPVSKKLLGKPDVQVTILPSGQTWDPPKVPSNASIMTWTLTLNNALSKGRVQLNSSDPFAAPVAWANYFTRKEDKEALAWAVKEVRNMTSREPIKSRLGRELMPGPEIPSWNMSAIEDYVSCGPEYVRTRKVPCDTMVVNHFAGTTKMGDPLTDPDVVVDNYLRVIKVKRLRVADASVMPSLPSGNPHATVVMIAERAAEFVLSDYDSNWKFKEKRNVV